MRVLQINIFGNLSTGRIAVDLYRTLKKQEHEGVVAFARGSIAEDVPCIRIGNMWDVRFHALMTRITDKTGFYSKPATRELIERIKVYRPDVIHLHNIHGYYIHIGLLFEYLKTAGIPVVWTLHDCWAFTGHCCHFDRVHCDRWKTGCHDCPEKRAYPASWLIDNSRWNYEQKKALFTGVPNMTLVTPSKWLAGLVKQSFLKEYPVEVIPNGIDLDVFKPSPSNFRTRYGLEGKFIVLGVASTWGPRKGLADFVELSQMLDDTYKVVVIGAGKKQLRSLPENILGLTRTDSVKQLAEIYTAADVYVNASLEETFGLPTVEAMACGTPVIVYNKTAVPEPVGDHSGVILQENSPGAIVSVLASGAIKKHRSISIRNDAMLYKKDNQFDKYIALYKNGSIE